MSVFVTAASSEVTEMPLPDRVPAAAEDPSVSEVGVGVGGVAANTTWKLNNEATDILPSNDESLIKLDLCT